MYACMVPQVRTGKAFSRGVAAEHLCTQFGCCCCWSSWMRVHDRWSCDYSLWHRFSLYSWHIRVVLLMLYVWSQANGWTEMVNGEEINKCMSLLKNIVTIHTAASGITLASYLHLLSELCQSSIDTCFRNNELTLCNQQHQLLERNGDKWLKDMKDSVQDE